MDQKSEQEDYGHASNSSSNGSHSSAPPGQYMYGVNYYGSNVPQPMGAVPQTSQYYPYDPHGDGRPGQPRMLRPPGGQPMQGQPAPGMIQPPVPPHLSGQAPTAAGPSSGGASDYPTGMGVQGPVPPSQAPSYPVAQPPVIVDQQLTPRKQMSHVSRTLMSQPRKRALTACDTCRVRKIKCDNLRPRCSSCVKNGNLNCHYKTDDQKDPGLSETSADILNKLNVLLKDVQDLKKAQGIEEGDEALERDTKRRRRKEELYHFDNCVWDMSLTSILRWNYFKKSIDEKDSQVSDTIGKLIKTYNNSDAVPFQNSPFDKKIKATYAIDDLLGKFFPNLINSFFINCHTKVPVLDLLDLIESIEIYKIVKNYNPEINFVRLLEIYSESLLRGNDYPQLYYDALKASNIEDTLFRQRAFKSLCKSIPILIIVCALGAISTPVQLDNLTKFDSSTEERKSFEIGSFADADRSTNLFDDLPKTRIELASSLLRFANLITNAYPFTIKPNSIREVVFKLLVSQFYLYCLTPLPAYRSISSACQSMMYYLEMKKNRSPFSDSSHDIKPYKKEIVDRLFWTCLKLECELRVELSPNVPISGITQVIPPTSFPKVADPVTVELRSDHSEASQLLANRYYDEHSWYYFLTEIAVRKVDNKMFDELHSLEAVLRGTWDKEEFYDENIWVSFIKYLNQYNGIINSLSPSIRNFVLQEIDVDQIYKRMKKKKENKIKTPSPSEFDIMDNLDDFLVDDDLLLRAQSESIMYIKTRIISSKLLLFRPIIYLILEDRIPFMELLGAAMAVMKANAPASTGSFGSLETPASVMYSSSSHSDSNPSEIDGGLDYYNLLHAPQHYQKQFPDEDFTNDIEYQEGESHETSSIDAHEFKLKNPPLTKSRILRIFVQHLISIPKLLIPKIGGHRHPGSWYYLRNLFIGNAYQFMLYMKIQDMVKAAMSDPNFQHFISLSPEVSSITEIGSMIEMLMPKQGMITMFEHSLMLFSYWKEESKDCEIYQQYIEKFLAKLR